MASQRDHDLRDLDVQLELLPGIPRDWPRQVRRAVLFEVRRRARDEFGEAADKALQEARLETSVLVHKRARELRVQLDHGNELTFRLPFNLRLRGRTVQTVDTATREKHVAGEEAPDAVYPTPASAPRTGEFLLAMLLSKTDREAVLGDLAEEFESYAVPRFGLPRARVWYWSQVGRSLLPLIAKRLKFLLRIAAVADLVHRMLTRG